ncbi:nuclear transport factor 2 family protein [Shewanella sp. UCD-KL12]|uniref:nuclear transport factor 2 family protein n=1 Tax=Shewanella sp. UCD-KL12 TaxID=1917163 RepID=UPI0009712E75|nr:nuclear transport factor 2 family protein [Shewanella sp. UCD-KL12]
MAKSFSYKAAKNRWNIPLAIITSLAFTTSYAYANETNETNETQVNPMTNTSVIAYPEANAVLDQLHRAASLADWEVYFSLYLPDAVFIGTDATEHWGMTEFEGYARPTDGWTYEPKSRTLISAYTQHKDQVLMFDELLDSASYGLSRGTGTLIKTDKGWKVAQYHLSFPIPNEIAKEITTRIKSKM